MPTALGAVVLLADEGVLSVLVVVIPSRAGTRRAAVAVSGRAPQVERGHVFRNIVAAVERVERVVRLACEKEGSRF